MARDLRSGRVGVLFGSLALSALLTAVSLRVPDYHWLAWFCLLPLFQAMRSLRLHTAALAGGLWGASLYVVCTADSAGLVVPVVPSFSSAVIMTAVPAVYASLGALLTRAVGFNPLMLALGWILVEFAFKPLGLQQGLLASTQIESAQFQWVARLLGYVLVAVFVACINATLLLALCVVRLGISSSRMPANSFLDCETRATSQVSVFQWLMFRQMNPRGPPMRSAAYGS
ncbi:MAG: hypothetical protein MI923_08805 [Phycisphaerales bacterium]|nr:hypothetical protein [Phycisphaerales bacterium]